MIGRPQTQNTRAQDLTISVWEQSNHLRSVPGNRAGWTPSIQPRIDSATPPYAQLPHRQAMLTNASRVMALN